MVAARHFAKAIDDSVPKGTEDEDAKIADAEPNDSLAYSGRHLKPVPLQEYEPPSAASTFVVSVPKNDEADTRARNRIDEILRELEEEMARPEPEPELEATPEAVPEQKSEPKPESEPEPAPEPEPQSTPETESKTEIEPKPERKLNLVFWQKAEPEPAHEESSNLPLDQIVVDDDLLDDIPLSARSPQADKKPDSLDSTAKLPVRRILQASEDAYGYGHGALNTRKPEPAAMSQGQEPNKGPEEYVASADRRERLQVNTDASASKAIQKSITSTSTLATKKRPLGFFAAIGSFIARIFHMDD